ncbi:type III secretion system inner membrane ring lipoprotein SctJ [Providencia sneebia]|uniref:Lipoprotein n=1 Tax=Providencia sneebia DSM 19967 TaxID=1141660 RepID=K8WLR1_9GAMM|nr:type III secretion inner membrane ring lipoprotein SctJ [Providencia sneebia]EKT60881.1 type III secretion system apparatus lipoprotein [Providencia sneebia DSM 19967]
MKIIKILLIINFIGLLTGCDTPILLSHLSQRQSNEVLAILQEHGVDAQRKQDSKKGDSIKVNTRDFVFAVELLHQYNLPTKEPVEIIQAFPNDSLVASPQAERTRLLSLIEQRLEQSLLVIPNIINARVHVSYPLNSHNLLKQPQKISCLVTYSGNEDEKLIMNKIKLFLTGSFTDTHYDNVSVVILNQPSLQHQTYSQKPILNINLPLLTSIILASFAIIIIFIYLYRRHFYLKKQHN